MYFVILCIGAFKRNLVQSKSKNMYDNPFQNISQLVYFIYYEFPHFTHTAHQRVSHDFQK